ncbi:A-kinase anchor protein 7 isoform X3 [Denticeps clupeoides]|nr:A-kinase anchoring protein 7 isoform X3 [Denticeps clupeoides]
MNHWPRRALFLAGHVCKCSALRRGPNRAHRPVDTPNPRSSAGMQARLSAALRDVTADPLQMTSPNLRVCAKGRNDVTQKAHGRNLEDRDPESAEKQTTKRAKRKAKKPCGRKQKPKTPESSGDLVAELPFAKAEVWKDLGFPSSESLKKKRKRGERVESEEDADKKKKKDCQRANYFVSVPITSSQIKSGVEAVQAAVLQKDPRLSRALIAPGSLHVTLLVTHLSNEDEVNLAAAALVQTQPRLQELLEGGELVLPFSGIWHFRHEVVFAQLAEGEHAAKLMKIAEAVRKTFEEKGIAAGDGKDFKPHLTFMKLSRAPKLRRQGIKKLDPELYAEFIEHQFGDETVSRIDLCSMLKKKTPDGYYHCEKSVTFRARCDARTVTAALRSQRRSIQTRLDQIKELLSQPSTRTKIKQELAAAPRPFLKPSSPSQ